MARYIKQGVARDGAGNVIADATISVYEAATTTVASIYTASSGGTAVNSVDSDTDGSFYFYVDDSDYDRTQKFKIVLSKTGYTSQTWDNVILMDASEISADAVLNTAGTSTSGNLPMFSDTTGLLVEDSGVAAANLAYLALSNLASVAINTSLISDADNTDDLGSSAKEWKDLYIDGTAYIDTIEIASGETITGDGTDMTIASGGAINLTATTDVVIPANVGITFGTGEKIEGDSTDLTVTSGAKINLTATSDVIVPVNVGIILGDGAEKIESNNTDLTINSGGDIALTATSDVNIPANVGVTFGDDGEKIEGDGTDLTITSSGKLNLNSTGVITASNQGIADNAVVTIDSASVADNDYAKFTANGLEGMSYAETRVDLDVGWKLIPAANYTATPASTSTITMGVDMTGSISVGDTLRYTISSTEYFGMVTAIAANLLTVAGAPLGGDVSNLQYGGGDVTQVAFSNADSASVVTTGTKYTLRWYKKKSYMVFYAVKMIGHDTHATEAKLTWKINATEVNTSAGGLSIAANDTFVNTVVDIATAAYDVNRGEDITLVATQGGSIDGYGIVANAILITP